MSYKVLVHPKVSKEITSILMHLKELISFKKTWKDLGYNIEILGIDFKRNDLIPIDEIITLLKNKNKSSRTSQHI